MNRIFKSVLVGVAAASMALIGTGAATASQVSSGKAAPEIIGGTKSADRPSAVQLVFKQGGAYRGCTGTAIAASWVLTAKHCIDSVSDMTVYYSTSSTNRGPAIKADRLYPAPQGDVALLHLATPKPLADGYPVVASGRTPTANTKGIIYGFGLRANSVASDGLYQANVTVTGPGVDGYNAPAFSIKGDNGASNVGDSGGPLFIGGTIAGVLSVGDVSNPGADIHAKSRYTNATTTVIRNWIKTTSGA
ncbi:S1 family peptidase [Psychromicrobium sp. YIM B11713]|uniref:S1 family peptidase n=1 Tax=Psychromicrobium sp. YIM B11713 TaxID=3145233 RepID=UPI00374FA5F3